MLSCRYRFHQTERVILRCDLREVVRLEQALGKRAVSLNRRFAVFLEDFLGGGLELLVCGGEQVGVEHGDSDRFSAENK